MNGYKVERIEENDQFPFRCKKCGNCCRRVKDSIMVDSMDIFRIAKHMQQNGTAQDISQVIRAYTDAHVLSENGFTVLMLKTVGEENACVFLRENRCLMQDTKPRVCRLYPCSVGPGEHGQDYSFWLCHDRHDGQHYHGARVTVSDWLSENFDEEDREFLRAEYQSAAKLDWLLGRIKAGRSRKVDVVFLFHRYFAYNLVEPFLPQHQKNTRYLLRELTRFANSWWRITRPPVKDNRKSSPFRLGGKVSFLCLGLF